MSRPDGRVPQQLRPLAAEPAALSRADGSARFSHGRTEVLASVFGPCEAKRSREQIDVAVLEVIVRPLSGLPGPVERETEQLISQTLSHLVLTALNPRTAISVVIQVLADDGALLATALHGACLALIHAGVPMRGVLGGCATALLADGATLLDPCADEERNAIAVVTLAFLLRQRADGTAERELLLSHCAGCVARDGQYELMQAAAQEAAACATAFMRQAMTRTVQPLLLEPSTTT
jgi:exosome complex component RRP46